jgi:hypothetical protein
VPATTTLSRDAALAELSRRYFASRGPATARDFANWSGLTLKDARAGIESVDAGFVREETEGRTLIYRPAALAPRNPDSFAFLMPDYDEYGMSYQDRGALFSQPLKLAHNRMIVVDGQIVGSWRRSGSGAGPTVEMDYALPLGRRQARAAAQAMQRFIAFA